jgi:hypothetical protein
MVIVLFPQSCVTLTSLNHGFPSNIGITNVYYIILQYMKYSNIRYVVNIYLQIMNQSYWFCGELIRHLQIIQCKFKLWQPLDFSFNYPIMMLTPNPPLKKTPFTIFFPMCIWITTIWLSKTITIITTSSTMDGIVFLITFVTFCGLFNFFYHKYLFNLKKIWTIIALSSKYN